MMVESSKGLFSVIIPTYNREKIISEALGSIELQSYRPIEVIVVDDGSSDNTSELVENWSNQVGSDNGISVHYSCQENSGPGAARNRGFEQCSGEFIQFLDSDDLLHRERLSKIANVFRQTGADFIQTGFESFDSASRSVTKQHFGRPGKNQIELALQGLLWANTLRSAFRRELLERIGPWDTEMTCFEDRDYVERAVIRATKPVAIREILASARRGGSTRVSDRLRSYEGRRFRILCEKRLAEATRNREDISTEAKSAFASRVYALGFRSNASGWPDLGEQCGEIADSMGVGLDAKGKLRRLVWKTGRTGGLVYGALSKLKSALRKAKV